MFTRITKTFEGWDCRNGNCAACAAGRKDDHGIHAAEVHHALAAELYDGRRAVLVLSIVTDRYPATVDRSRWNAEMLRINEPRGRDLSLHVQAARDEGRECTWIHPDTGRCEVRYTTALGASQLWSAVPPNERDVDAPGEMVWKLLEERFLRITSDPAEYEQPNEPEYLKAARAALATRDRAAKEATQALNKAFIEFEATCNRFSDERARGR